MKTRYLALPAAAAAVLLTACGTTHPASGSTPPAAGGSTPAASPAVNYQQQYLTDVAPYNAAIRAVSPNATSVTDPTIVAVKNASLAYSRALLQQAWPANAATDVHALAVASAKQSTDLDSDALMIANIASDAATATADAQTVRADLGLPAASESP